MCAAIKCIFEGESPRIFEKETKMTFLSPLSDARSFLPFGNFCSFFGLEEQSHIP
jgi:hypothetical protein